MIVPKPSLTDQGRLFFKHIVPAFVRPMRTLWNEVIGFAFLSFAVIAGFSGFRSLRNFDGAPENFFKLILIGVFVLIMAVYAFSSFRRARKISRS
ncbi:MAG: hypothetical protein WD696_19145 [Bryobacteraceae bacterium]